jgi:hypothetical protein
MNISIENLVQKFEIQGSFSKYEPIKTGHINDTYRIFNKNEHYPDYILQRINHLIFNNIPKLQENILRVTNHIRSKYQQTKNFNLSRSVITLVPAIDGKWYFVDDEGNYWRMMNFIKDSYSHDRLSSPQLTEKAGQAFGEFITLLADLRGEPLFETIKDFHNLEYRLLQFRNAIQENYFSRIDIIKKEIDWVFEREEEMLKFNKLGKEGKIPKRIIHYDTKINNILFDNNNNQLCVIDLDTVMPGYVSSDFGDAIRSGANTGAEDDPDLNNVSMNIDLFRGFATGYISAAGSFLTDYEIENLAFSAKLLTFMQSVRFLTDFINGDRYYKINHPMHNLQRTKAQFKLLFSMEDQNDLMLNIIDDLAKEKCLSHA